ncbi:MAG TPA: hypothetical protein VKR55_22440 [Bradyrhizobium sp.]|uniref:hypothetical protein n=1 Tax=Bradyrhizobium sp. TaxID=376 RepID=UPI002CC37EC3|nr:hypothetical protein [Bradyrhizobium sp.]HLZ04896.1 hypothetical protein [Bradyrhizobium sp.]
MDPISHTDRLVAILRQRLRERTRTQTTKPARRGSPQAEPAVSGLSGLAALEGADSRQLRRACIQALLADQLGGSLLNDAQFQQIVTRVVDAIGEDPVAARLLDQAVSSLRAD